MVTQGRSTLVVDTPERGASDIFDSSNNMFDTADQNVIIILKGTDEAYCADADGSDCKFSYLTTETPTMTDGVVAFNTDKYEVTFTGTNLDATPANTRVIIEGNEQTVTASTATEVKATITNLVNSSSFWASLYTSKGKVGIKSGLSVAPKFTLVSPNVGSEGGTLLTYPVLGVGTADTITSTTAGAVVSQTYDTITYKTNAAAASSAAVVLTIAGVSTNCDNTDTALCNYETTTATSPLSLIHI